MKVKLESLTRKQKVLLAAAAVVVLASVVTAVFFGVKRHKAKVVA